MSVVDGFDGMMRAMGYTRTVLVPVPFLVCVVDHLRAIGGERERELADKLLTYTAVPAEGGESK